MLILFVGICLIVSTHAAFSDLARFICYLALAIAASLMKVTVPGVTGTISLNFLFMLIYIVELNFTEAVAIGVSAVVVQCVWQSKSRPGLVKLSFNIANIAVAIGITKIALTWGTDHFSKPLGPLLLVLVACTYFVTNTFPVASIISLTESKPLARTWRECFFWSVPYYLTGGVIAQVIHLANIRYSWQSSFMVLPIVYIAYRSYRFYIGRLETEKTHAENMANLHLRTIQALSLAIEAKDHTTHDHLRRVQVYAVELGKDLKLPDDELAALRAAAVLHDIGKLAVPEHIISKPGKLTPEEFEKMKVHPVVGAEILEEVDFPYPVVPIVRAHHEKWNGAGYPYGLKGEEIPIGARILSAVDCLDALASDRQYRRALPLDEAMQKVVSESGTSFDPKVVEVLYRRYRDLEKLAQGERSKSRLSTEMKIRQGLSPAAGFETAAVARPDFLESIAAARQEAQALFELTQEIGNSLSLKETLSVLGIRLKTVIHYDTIAIYVTRGKYLEPEYVSGDDFRVISSLRIPIGEGLSGWVAQTSNTILNGNPAVEPGYVQEDGRPGVLRSALAVPLAGLNGTLGVLALYRIEKDAFSADNLRVMLAVSSKAALAIENALKFRQAESSAVTDFLTGLPNARSLFRHLDSQLSAAVASGTTLTVMVCDLDGFKQVNDRFGHLEANKVLQRVATNLRQHCRQQDYVARMGGDEFVVVLPGLPNDQVGGKIAQFDQDVHTAGREICGTELLSLSIGAAFYPEDGENAEALLAEADRRMYTAKQSRKSTGLKVRPGVGLMEMPTTTIIQ